MATTEVILTSNLPGLGAESDKVTVAAGYARNYLFPKSMAIPVTQANERRLAALRTRRELREKQEVKSMKELAGSLSRIRLKLTVRAGEDGKMFGAVTAGNITDELKSQLDVTLDRRKIHLEAPLKELGEHDLELRLHPDVHATLKVVLESSTPLPEKPAAEGRGGAQG